MPKGDGVVYSLAVEQSACLEFFPDDEEIPSNGPSHVQTSRDRGPIVSLIRPPMNQRGNGYHTDVISIVQ